MQTKVKKAVLIPVMSSLFCSSCHREMKREENTNIDESIPFELRTRYVYRCPICQGTYLTNTAYPFISYKEKAKRKRGYKSRYFRNGNGISHLEDDDDNEEESPDTESQDDTDTDDDED